MAIREQEAPAAPTIARSPIEAYLGRLHARYADLRDGVVADYIPELAKADPDAFGIAIATTEGSVYEVGDTRQAFTIQSISKPLTYALVLDALGDHEVHRRIGVEPTGDAFNSITLHPETGSPLNAMVNAGAIAAAGLVSRTGDSDPMARLLDSYARFAGRPLTVDERIYRSERETGHRNRAIANLLRGSGVLDEDPETAVDRYFRQCAIEVDTRDLAVIAATLATGGTNPLTGVVAATPRTVRTVLAVMASCGMYDGAGEWFVGVGLPAKSGVSGGILAVLPGRLGIAVWSPPVDARGNSVRGVAVCRDLSVSMDLHPFTGMRTAPIRSDGTVANRRSKRVRPPAEAARLEVEGGRSHLLQLQGEIGFAAIEAVLRAIGPLTAERVVLDLGRVSRLDASTAPLLADLATSLRDGERTGLAWSEAHAHAAALDAVDRLLEATQSPRPMRFGELDAAIEWCEERIVSNGPVVRHSIALTDHPVLAGLSVEELPIVAAALAVRRWGAGEPIVRHGDPADELFLLTSGELSVYVPLEGREPGRRLATLTAGMVLGEVSFLGGGTRTADVLADSDVEAWILDTTAFAAIRAAHPAIAASLLENLYRILAGIAKRLTDEVAAIAA